MRHISHRTSILIVAAVLLLFNGFAIVPMVQQWWAQGFATTEGTVSASATHLYSGGHYSLKIQFEYTVNGTVYRGDRYRYDSEGKAGVGKNEAEFWPKGRKLTVYYNPHNPRNSLLCPGVVGRDVLNLIVVTPFDAIALWFGFSIWTQKRRLQEEAVGGLNQTVGGVELSCRAGEIRARFPRTPLLFFAFGAFSFSAVIGGAITSMMLHDESNPLSPAGAALIWLFTIGAAIAAILIYRHRILSGRFDLVIDETNAVIDLPATCNRKARRKIRFDQIQVIGMAVREKWDGNRGHGCVYDFVPMLEIAGVERVREDLAVMKNREDALKFVGWLRQTLPQARPTSNDVETESWLEWMRRTPPPVPATLTSDRTKDRQ